MDLDRLAVEFADPIRSCFERQRAQFGRATLIEKTGSDDSPLHCVLLDKDGTPRFYLAYSNPNFPESVEQASSKAMLATRLVDAKRSRRILTPTALGQVAGRSYAIYPWCRPIEGLALRVGRRTWLRGILLPWLAGVTELTVRSVDQEEEQSHFLDPLAHMAASSDLSASLRNQAARTRARLESREFTPKHVLSHGDLWLGNVMLARLGTLHWAPVVIDWGGSSRNGYPIFDLLRLGGDFRLGTTRLRGELIRHSRSLGSRRVEVVRDHTTAALAGLYRNLGEFEVHRYVDMAEHCYRQLDECGV